MSKVLADYNDTDYQSFWDNRHYEDFCDKLALKRLLSKIPSKKTKLLIDIGGGFGRLAPVYIPLVKRATIFDYSQKLLNEARGFHGTKIDILQGSLFSLPREFKFDIASMVRVSHHIDDLATVLKEIRMILNQNGYLIIEIANKRNILEIVRYIFKRNIVNPFSKEPESRNQKGFYNYHPKYIERLLKTNGFIVKKRLSVSNFRSTILKKILGHKILMGLEWILFPFFNFIQLSPSTYYLCKKESN